MGAPCDCGAATGVDGEGAISPPAAAQIDALPRASIDKRRNSAEDAREKKKHVDVQQRAAVKETTKHQRP